MHLLISRYGTEIFSAQRLESSIHQVHLLKAQAQCSLGSFLKFFQRKFCGSFKNCYSGTCISQPREGIGTSLLRRNRTKKNKITTADLF